LIGGVKRRSRKKGTGQDQPPLRISHKIGQPVLVSRIDGSERRCVHGRVLFAERRRRKVRGKKGEGQKGDAVRINSQGITFILATGNGDVANGKIEKDLEKESKGEKNV